MSEATPKTKGVVPDLSAAMYQISGRTHTMGNAFRVPHPSENLIQLRIQMFVTDGPLSLNALLEALDSLDGVCESMEERYLTSLWEGQYERRGEKG
ncbi:hypothetical protein F5141DRAFT_1120280 [Pisolithus sp. B1]|nr:hypothetical protein F5141DRAFT_1120280 [Pisolithus sp. B1]